jgi:hypothetical protein
MRASGDLAYRFHGESFLFDGFRPQSYQVSPAFPILVRGVLEQPRLTALVPHFFKVPPRFSRSRPL